MAITNKLEVLRQDPYTGPGLTFCAPLLLNLPNSGFENRNQFFEWIEYLRFINVSQVLMPEPIQHHLYKIPQDLLDAIEYYKDIGFLRTFAFAYVLFAQPYSVKSFAQVICDCSD